MSDKIPSESLTQDSPAASSKGAKERGESSSIPIMCRGPLGQRIALEYAEPIKHKSPILRAGHQSFIVVGRSGCGKTTLVLSLIPYFARLNAIVYATRIPNTDIFSAIARYCKETMRDDIPADELARLRRKAYEDATVEEKAKMDANKPDAENADGKPERKRIRFYVVNTPAQFNEIITPLANEQRFGEDLGWNSLCIFDDFRTKAGTESDPYVSCAIMANCTLRNFGCYSIWMTQQYSKLTPTTLRANCNNLICFGMADRYARETLLRDLAPLNQRFGEDGVRALYDDICLRPHGYLWMILKGNGAELYRYEDDTTGLQRVESADERAQRRFGEVDRLEQGDKQELHRITHGSRIAKLRDMLTSHDVLLRRPANKADTRARRLAAILWTRIWALAEKIASAEGRDPSDIINEVEGQYGTQ